MRNKLRKKNRRKVHTFAGWAVDQGLPRRGGPINEPEEKPPVRRPPPLRIYAVSER